MFPGPDQQRASCITRLRKNHSIGIIPHHSGMNHAPPNNSPAVQTLLFPHSTPTAGTTSGAVAPPVDPLLVSRFPRLYVLLISLHGLVRGEHMELGRDADTGGQV